jgi:hypothetical protein
MGSEPALVRMLRAGGDQGSRLDYALDALAEVFGRPSTAERVGACFTCHEANRIALVLYASRHTDAACVWLDAHAASDDEDEPHGSPGFDAARYLRASLG